MECKDCRRSDIKCCNTCGRDGETCDVSHSCGKDCKEYEQPKQTQGDKIRAMSDEEIAEFFCGKFMEWNKECDNDRFSDVIFTREERFLSWLKSEVKE